MSDRAPVTVHLAKVPPEHREHIADLFLDHGIEAHDGVTGGPGWSASDIHPGLRYYGDDLRLGTDDEIAETLSNLGGVIARVSQEAKYEFDGTTVYVVDDAIWGGSGSQDGELVVHASVIDKLVNDYIAGPVDAEGLIPRLRRLTGYEQRRAFDEAWESATTPLWEIVGPPDSKRVQLTMTFRPQRWEGDIAVDVDTDNRVCSWTDVVDADAIPDHDALREARSPWWIKNWDGPWELDVVSTPYRPTWSVTTRTFDDGWTSQFTSSEKAEYPLPEGGVWRRTTFQTPFEQHVDRAGQKYWIVREITEPDEHHDAEVLPMFEIRFEDETRIEAWPEELFDLAPEAVRS